MRHLEGHKLAAAWDLPILIIDTTARETFFDLRLTPTQTTPCNILTTEGEFFTSEGLVGGGGEKKDKGCKKEVRKKKIKIGYLMENQK